jgi:hypothetical protein
VVAVAMVSKRRSNGLHFSSDFKCPYDKLPCRRFDYYLEFGACFVWDVNGRLRFVCKRFVAPVGFSVPKQLTPEEVF